MRYTKKISKSKSLFPNQCGEKCNFFLFKQKVILIRNEIVIEILSIINKTKSSFLYKILFFFHSNCLYFLTKWKFSTKLLFFIWIVNFFKKWKTKECIWARQKCLVSILISFGFDCLWLDSKSFEFWQQELCGLKEKQCKTCSYWLVPIKATGTQPSHLCICKRQTLRSCWVTTT